MRVLWLTPDKPDDISVGRRRIAECLERDGIEMTLRGTTLRTALRSLGECVRGRYDAVVGTTRAGAFVGGAARLLGTPLIVDHVDPIRQFAETHSRPSAAAVRLAENAAFALADGVLYVYEEERARVERYAAGATETDLGVAHDRFADPDPTAVERARERLADAGVDPGDPVAVYVGGLEPIYRVPELLAAMTHCPEWTLVVLGAGSLEGRVERIASERDNVVFLGTVDHDDVPGYLAAADVGVSLVDDPHTLKVLEYAAAGLGVVQAAGRAEARFGEHVEYCQPRPHDIADAIRRAGERGANEEFRAFVRQFDYGAVATVYRKVLKRVASC